MKIDRRECLGGAVAALLAATPSLSRAEEAGGMSALSNRAHILAHPSVKEKLTWCFADILGCAPPLSLVAPGRSEPILAFRFPAGGSLSVEFTEEALDEQQMRRGAWLEIRADNPAGLKRKILAAGLPQVQYWATRNFYFVAPGGQVFGIFQPDEMR